MAVGKEIGDFNTKYTSVTLEPGKDGDYKVSARCFMADGDIVDANGEGKTVYDGDHASQVAGITEVARTRAYAIQGEINLKERSFVGKMYERIRVAAAA